MRTPALALLSIGTVLAIVLFLVRTCSSNCEEQRMQLIRVALEGHEMSLSELIEKVGHRTNTEYDNSVCGYRTHNIKDTIDSMITMGYIEKINGLYRMVEAKNGS